MVSSRILNMALRKIVFTCTSLSVLRPNFWVPTWTYNWDPPVSSADFRELSVIGWNFTKLISTIFGSVRLWSVGPQRTCYWVGLCKVLRGVLPLAVQWERTGIRYKLCISCHWFGFSRVVHLLRDNREMRTSSVPLKDPSSVLKSG